MKENTLQKRIGQWTIFLFVLGITTSLHAQSHTVTGTVIDADNGNSLPGLNIVLKGTTTGTTTNSKGKYNISVPSSTDTLVFSFIGFKTQEIPINGRSEINVKMVSKSLTGEDVVVTAYGQTQEEEDVVGAVTSLSQGELDNLKTAPSANLTTSLAGRIPGLIGYQRSGEPGANNADFFVRGITTFGQSATPLILIDGIRSSVNQLANLNPDDIANFSVLQDATATSLYGSEAANGVLIVETKTGKVSPLQVDLRIETSYSKPTEVPEFADPITYMEQANSTSLSRSPLAPLPYSRRKIDKTKADANKYLYPAVNWRDKLFKNHTLNNRYKLNVSGGGEIAQYYVSGSFDQSNGLLEVPNLNDFNNNIDLKNYSLRTNVNANLTNTTDLAIKINGQFADYNGPINGGKSVYHQVVNANPVRFPATYPVDSAHSYVQHPLFGNQLTGSSENSTMLNPYAQMVQGYKAYNRSTINAQLRVTQDLKMVTQGLEVGGRFNVQRYAYSENIRAYNPYYYQASPLSIREDSYSLQLLNPNTGNNHLEYTPGTETITSSIQFRAHANYQRTFNDTHGINSFLIFQMRNQTYDNKSTLQGSLPHRNVNLAGRFSYNYKHRYYGEINFGLTGSERYAAGHRYGFFPSFGLKYNISNENFWKPLQSVLPQFAIRATYGLSGNDRISDQSHRFLYLSTVNFNSAGYTTGEKGSYTLNGIRVNRYSNTDITWERSKQLNLGLDLNLLNKLTINANFYRKTTTNILQSRLDLTAAMGLTANPRVNYGAAKTHGFDTRLKYTQNFNENWFLQLKGNFTFARSEITKYSEDPYPNSPNRLHVGQPIGTIYGLYADRLFAGEKEVENSPIQNFGSYGAGDLKYRDINGDGQITNNDVVPMGFPRSPEINYGFGFSMVFKNLDFSAFFEGIARESFLINTSRGSSINNQGTGPFIGGHQLLKVYAEDHWSADNPNLDALYPHFSTPGNPEGVYNNAQNTNWFLRNGSFLRIKRVEIGYTLPQVLTEKISLQNLRIYVNGRNLYHISPFKLWDPEMAGGGLGYPLQRVFNVGLDVKF